MLNLDGLIYFPKDLKSNHKQVLRKVCVTRSNALQLKLSLEACQNHLRHLSSKNRYLAQGQDDFETELRVRKEDMDLMIRQKDELIDVVERKAIEAQHYKQSLLHLQTDYKKLQMQMHSVERESQHQWKKNNKLQKLVPALLLDEEVDNRACQSVDEEIAAKCKNSIVHGWNATNGHVPSAAAFALRLPSPSVLQAFPFGDNHRSVDSLNTAAMPLTITPVVSPSSSCPENNAVQLVEPFSFDKESGFLSSSLVGVQKNSTHFPRLMLAQQGGKQELQLATRHIPQLSSPVPRSSSLAFTATVPPVSLIHLIQKQLRRELIPTPTFLSGTSRLKAGASPFVCSDVAAVEKPLDALYLDKISLPPATEYPASVPAPLFDSSLMEARPPLDADSGTNEFIADLFSDHSTISRTSCLPVSTTTSPLYQYDCKAKLLASLPPLHTFPPVSTTFRLPYACSLLTDSNAPIPSTSEIEEIRTRHKKKKMSSSTDKGTNKLASSIPFELIHTPSPRSIFGKKKSLPSTAASFSSSLSARPSFLSNTVRAEIQHLKSNDVLETTHYTLASSAYSTNATYHSSSSAFLSFPPSGTTCAVQTVKTGVEKGGKPNVGMVRNKGKKSRYPRRSRSPFSSKVNPAVQDIWF